MRRKKKKFVRIKKGKQFHIDYPLLISIISLTLFGVLMVYNASVVEAYRNFSDRYYFAKQQAIWAAVGVLIMVGLSFIPYKIYKKIGIWAFVFSLVTLVIVIVPSLGSKVLGARRWISIGGQSIQPAEFSKLTLAMYLASFFEKKRKLNQFLFIITILIGLIMLQPDLGTAIVVSTIAASMYLISGAPVGSFLFLIFGGIITVIAFIFTSSYRTARIATFLNPTKDPLGASYHIRQILIAIGSGGLFGVGIGKSRQKFEYIPAATTDSIFAIIAEEIGFVGSVLIILVFVFVINRAFKIAKNAPDKFSQLLAGGIATWIGAQSLLNFSTMVALAPLTGIPLPFISYGGSATISTLVGVGVLLNISKHCEKG